MKVLNHAIFEGTLQFFFPVLHLEFVLQDISYSEAPGDRRGGEGRLLTPLTMMQADRTRKASSGSLGGHGRLA